MVAVRSILCPVDFSETSRRALDYALLLARTCAAELTVLHVVEDVPLLTAYAGLPEGSLVEKVEESARMELAELVAAIPAQGFPIRSDLIHGTTWKAILQYAAQHGSELIVMGSHGRKGLEHAIFGSVTERVIRRAACPVLIVPPPGAAAAKG